MSLVKKLLVFSLVVTTVLWSLGGLTVKAEGNYGAGSLLALEGVSGAAVYYIGSDGMKYVFPDQKTYYTWYANFDDVVRVPVSELDMYQDGGAVTYRPGTKLITHSNTAKIYAVSPGGVLHWIPTAEVAETLYGATWYTRVLDAIPGYFSSSYTSGSDLSNTYPDGTLLKMGSDYYYVEGGMVRPFADGDAFEANGFVYSNAVTVSSVSGYSTGESITGEEAALSGYMPGETSQPPVVIGGDVSVALYNTPGASQILSDSTANEYPQALIPFTTVKFTAGSEASQVNTLKFTRTGIASDADLGTLYLYEGDTRLAEYTSFSDKVVTFSNSAGLFTVPAGSSKVITLKGDLARGSTSVVAGKTIAFGLNSASDVVTAGGAINGSFPLTGNVMETTAVADLGHVHATSYKTYPTTVKADEANRELWRMNLTATDQDMEISRIRMTMVGTIASTDIQNLKLEVAGVQVGSTVEIGADNSVVFDLSGDPLTITSGQTKVLILRGDMMGGAGRTFKFTIQKSSDVSVYDTEYGVFNTFTITGTITAFGVVQPTTGSGTTIDSGTITVGLATDSPSGNIADAASGVTLAKYSFYAAGEDVKVESLTIDCYSSDAVSYLDNVKLLLDGSQIGTTDSTLKCDDGTDSTTYSFGNTFVVPNGEYKYVTVVADTSDSTVGVNDTYRIDLQAGSSNAVGQSTLTSLSTTAQAGRLLTVKSGTVSVAENTAFGDKSSSNPTGVAGATGAKIASFTITAGSGEAVDVTQIAMLDASAVSQMGDNFQNLKLMHSSTQLGTTIGNLNAGGTATSYSFSPSPAVRIASGEQYVVDVYADIKSSVQDSATVLSPVIIVDSITATGVNTSADASYSTDTNLQNGYIAAAGNLTITADPDTAIAQQLVMGATGYEVAKFRLTADASEAVNITELVISDNVSDAATGTLKNLKLYVGGEQVGNTVQLDTTSATSTYVHATFSSLDINIPVSSTVIVTVKADVSPYSDGAVSASTHTLAILANYSSGNEGVTAFGVGSGTELTGGTLDFSASPDADVTTNQMTVYRTKLTATFASDSPSGASTGGTGKTVAKFVVTNSSNVGAYSATIETMNVGMDQTGISIPAATTRALTIYKDSLATTALATTNFGGGSNQNFSDTGISTFIDVEITAGASKTFWVTLDTNDAASTDSLSISLEAGDVIWTDGVTSSITTVNSLPLTPYTLTY
ncbi:hypothetical protein KKH39_04735 [Patescibacteria group bacterium]|nr:hypothetical protein [Patescibacteria group bacterium]